MMDQQYDARSVALTTLLDRDEITRVVNDWGLFRDTGRWDQLLSLFTDDATMHTTWCACSAEAFIDRSRQAASRGMWSQHFIGAASIEIAGSRAIVETRMILMLRASIAGTAVDVTCHGRFYDRFVKTRHHWRIQHRVPVYDKDRLDPVTPGSVVQIDQAALAGFPEGYRHVAYVQSLGGAKLTPGLPTRHSAEEAKLCADGAAWLRGSSC